MTHSLYPPDTVCPQSACASLIHARALSMKRAWESSIGAVEILYDDSRRVATFVFAHFGLSKGGG
jgi:hypothetical protein